MYDALIFNKISLVIFLMTLQLLLRTAIRAGCLEFVFLLEYYQLTHFVFCRFLSFSCTVFHEYYILFWFSVKYFSWYSLRYCNYDCVRLYEPAVCNLLSPPPPPLRILSVYSFCVLSFSFLQFYCFLTNILCYVDFQ